MTPTTWQGWIVTLAYLGAVLMLGSTLAEPQPYLFWTLLAFATAAFIVVAFLTGRR